MNEITVKETLSVNSSPLRTLQQQMLSWLQEADPLIKQSVTGTVKVPVETRLAIYANAYRFRLVEALEENFPALNTLLGDEAFFQLGTAYLEANPSRHYSLRYFGHQMSDFLTYSPDYQAQTILSEMAEFEWLLRDVFDAADSKLMTLDDLQQFEPQLWPQIKFIFHPSLKRIDLTHNVPQLWQVIDKEEPKIDIEKNDYPIAWCLWRNKDLLSLYRSMDVDEAWAMDAMMSGADFSAVCSGICEWVDEQNAALRAVGFMQNWINDGFIKEIAL
ncbi:DNA-binding domain-containing protein [sulfur-oxidizing endosymbiont of Gigantopelta aegis]|uniref:HvfC/BufC N-terminal domain-containing protein n=1 Tax=sulfur-oxidizing endosymbiont of Gigantopelta aegis TaxID=2794934 RepID=UPI0018DBE54D|nr:DNA-binding domain-containing protein [sulfur-oxidizing endosymbiont of Gigantopelta aegis]